MRIIYSHKWWRRRFLVVIGGLLLASILELFLQAVPLSIRFELFVTTGFLILATVILLMFPPSKFRMFLWRVRNSHVEFRDVLVSSEECALVDNRRIFFLKPDDIEKLSVSCDGIHINTRQGILIERKIQDECDADMVDEVTQQVVWALLTAFIKRESIREVYELLAVPLNRLRFRYTCFVILPLMIVGALAFLVVHNLLSPGWSFIFTHFLIPVAVLTVGLDYKNRSKKAIAGFFELHLSGLSPNGLKLPKSK